MTVVTCFEDLRLLAKRRVPRMFYDDVDSGSWTESTYRANESDFQRIKLRQRVAVDMNKRSTRTTMVGIDAAMPVAIAPTDLAGMQHADGEILAARAAEKFGIPFTLSTMSICSMEVGCNSLCARIDTICSRRSIACDDIATRDASDARPAPRSPDQGEQI